MNTIFATASIPEQDAFRKWVGDMLHIGPVKVTFIKKDGTERVMLCTLEEGVAIPHVNVTGRVRVRNDDICPVWDLDEKSWRSFRYDSVVKVNLSIE
jgi:hypothetical protein